MEQVVISREEVQSYVDRLKAIFGVRSPFKFRLEEHQQKDPRAEAVGLDCPYSIVIEYVLPKGFVKGIDTKLKSDMFHEGKDIYQVPKCDFNTVFPRFPRAIAEITGVLFANKDSVFDAGLDGHCDFYQSLDRRGNLVYGRVCNPGLLDFTSIALQDLKKEAEIKGADAASQVDSRSPKEVALSNFEGLVKSAEENKHRIKDIKTLLIECAKAEVADHRRLKSQGGSGAKFYQPKDGKFDEYPELRELCGKMPIEHSIADALIHEHTRPKGIAYT